LEQKNQFKKYCSFATLSTAFFFGAVYTESLFLLLAVLSIYLARKEKYILSGFFASLASATRILGILLFAVLLIEVVKNRLNITSFRKKISAISGILIAPTGMLSYMYFLQMKFGDALYFLNAQPFFGAERSSLPIITLPQVVYRYVKIFLTTHFSISYFISISEFLFTLVPLCFILLNYKKIRFSYFVFMVGALIIPTLTGTFSSMPRYSLVAFLALPLVAKFKNKNYILTSVFFVLLQIIYVTLFVRGIWVS